MTQTYSTRSWWGVAVMALIGVPRLIDLAMKGTDASVFDVGLFVVVVVATVLTLVSTVAITADGIERHPGTVRIPWADVVGFEAQPRPDRVLMIRVVRRQGRRIGLTPFFMSAGRGRALLDALEAARAGAADG
jgi:hypothetical protein